MHEMDFTTNYGFATEYVLIGTEMKRDPWIRQY